MYVKQERNKTKRAKQHTKKKSQFKGKKHRFEKENSKICLQYNAMGSETTQDDNGC